MTSDNTELLSVLTRIAVALEEINEGHNYVAGSLSHIRHEMLEINENHNRIERSLSSISGDIRKTTIIETDTWAGSL